MKHASTIIHCALFLASPWMGSQAQEKVPSVERITVQLDGLDSATRDALAAELRPSTDLQLVFACVPAGILVFESRSTNGRTQLEARTRMLLNGRANGATPRFVDQSLEQAEHACSVVRDR
jgi:hypothetical protein